MGNVTSRPDEVAALCLRDQTRRETLLGTPSVDHMLIIALNSIYIIPDNYQFEAKSRPEHYAKCLSCDEGLRSSGDWGQQCNRIRPGIYRPGAHMAMFLLTLS
jgi:hypothetical protein